MDLSLNARLLVTSIGLLGVGLATGGGAFFTAADNITRASTREHLQTRSAELLDAVRRHQKEKLSTVKTWAEAEVMQSSLETGEPKFAEDYLKRVIEGQEGAIGVVALLDPKGIIVTAVRPAEAAGAQGQSVEQARGKVLMNPLIQQAAGGRGGGAIGLVSELSEGLAQARSTHLLVVQPVADFTGEVVGVLVATISGTGLEQLLRGIVGDAGALVPIFFDAERRFLVSIPGRDGEALLRGLDLGALSGQPSEALSEVSAGNEGYLAVSALSPEGQLPRWGAAMFVSEREALGPLRHLRVYLAGGFLLILFLVGAVSVVGLRRAMRPLREIAASMGKVAAGDFNGRIPGVSQGDLGTLVSSFNQMVTEVGNARARLEATNASIERQVVERTCELHASREEYRGLAQKLDVRNHDLQLVLDTADQGFMIAGQKGALAAEHSRAIETWLGPVVKGTKVWDYFATVDPDFARVLKDGWENLQDGILSVDDILGALPSRLDHQGRHLQLVYKSIPSTQGVLVVASDITAQLGREASEKAQRELLQIFEAIGRDRPGFLAFFTEAQELARAITASPSTLDAASLYRAVHTLKGNAAMYGLAALARVCHEVEERLASANARLSPEDRGLVQAAWDKAAAQINALLGDGRATGITIDEVEYQETLAALRGLTKASALVERVERWRHEPAQLRLTRIGEQASALAQRLGKGPIRVSLEAGRVRLPSAEWSEFWGSFTHVVRNAVDHGLEGPEERLALGKPEEGTIRLSAREEDEQIVVSISDDGAGICWAKLRASAATSGLPCETHEDLTQALFADGVTTREEVSEISGRGMGMGAVRAACQKLGGTIHVSSRPGAGTTFEFRFPARGQQPVRDAA